MRERDELIVVPEGELGGFICPICHYVAIGKKWNSAKYCPECGQSIKISTKQFNTLREHTDCLGFAEKEKCCTYYSKIGPEPSYERVISGIYKERLDHIIEDKKGIPGQMNITDFI